MELHEFGTTVASLNLTVSMQSLPAVTCTPVPDPSNDLAAVTWFSPVVCRHGVDLQRRVRDDGESSRCGERFQRARRNAYDMEIFSGEYGSSIACRA